MSDMAETDMQLDRRGGDPPLFVSRPEGRIERHWPGPASSRPQHDAITLCANSRGRPWPQDGFRRANAAIEKLRPLKKTGP